VNYIGIAGVFVGTMLGFGFQFILVDTIVTYKKVLSRPLSEFYLRWLQTILLTVGLCIASYYLSRLVRVNSIYDLILLFVVVIGFNFFALCFIYWRNDDFQYFIQLVKNFMKNLEEKNHD
ncbi:TPA: hypothetical protein ACL7X0_001706, partial [Streptococcus pneumoniae]